MPQTINTNIASLNAQRNLSTSQGSLATSMQRLSSGLRVNSAKDDAAGLAIAERMNTQVRGLNVAARNANDGISLAQTAEGALGKVGDMLQRMRELAVQSSNATNSETDRKALDAEVQALKAEIARVADQTSFNSTKLLDGSFASQQFQVGANAGETIGVASIADAKLANLGTSILVTAASPDVTTGITGYAAQISDGDVTINGKSIGLVPSAVDGAARASQIVTAINNSGTGVLASYDAATKQISLQSASEIKIEGTGATVANIGFGNGTISTTASASGIADLDVTNFATAQIALLQIDGALTQINSSRADLGALQSRFESAISNIQVTAENLSAARGRIMDADFAAETANLSRAQILQQAGTAMVAQANALPQQVLQLLKG